MCTWSLTKTCLRGWNAPRVGPGLQMFGHSLSYHLQLSLLSCLINPTRPGLTETTTFFHRMQVSISPSCLCHNLLRAQRPVETVRTIYWARSLVFFVVFVSGQKGGHWMAWRREKLAKKQSCVYFIFFRTILPGGLLLC